MIPQTAMPSRVSEPPLSDGSEPGPIRIFTPPPRSMTFAEPQAPMPSGIKPFAYIKYRWVMVLFLGGFLACIFAAVAWKLIPSKYTTYSMVRVFSTDPVVHSKEDVRERNDFATYIKTQAAMIRSHFVLTAALRDPSVAGLPMLREQADPIRFLEEELKIEFTEGSEIIKISLSGDDPRACAMIVNSIQEAFFREVVDEEIKRKKARLRQLEDENSKMQEEVKQKYKQNEAATILSPETEAFPGLSGQIAANQLVRLEENLAKLEGDIQSWESAQADLEKKLKNVPDEVPAAPPGYAQSLDNDPNMQTLAKKIEQKSSKLDYLVKLSGNPNLPAVVEFKQQIVEHEEEREKFRNERVAEYQKAQLPLVEKKLKSDLERSKTAIVQLTSQKEKLIASVEKYQKTLMHNGLLGDLPIDFKKVDVRERAKIITEMLDKANLLRLEVNAPPRVQDFQRAAVPLKKEMKKQLLGTIVAGLMGFGLIGFGVVVYESRIRRAMSLADVQKAVLGPMVGVLPHLEKGSNALTSLEAIGEAIEKARTHLLQQFSRSGGKIIAVTSALTEEGKGFLAEQLAVSFARSGSRTLLVDFDLRTPSLHRALGVSNERGLCEVMLGKAEFLEAVQILPNGTMFIPAGKWCNEIRLGLTPERIEALLQWLRPQFDFAILNTHALLSVAETFLICRNVDGVLLSVERLESRLPLVARAHEKLAAVAPEGFGIVFQGASAEECLH